MGIHTRQPQQVAWIVVKAGETLASNQTFED